MQSKSSVEGFVSWWFSLNPKMYEEKSLEPRVSIVFPIFFFNPMHRVGSSVSPKSENRGKTSIDKKGLVNISTVYVLISDLLLH